MNNHPLISVVTVVLNDQLNIEKTLLSVINQTYPNIEYIVIDGGSSDGTLDLIKKYENKISHYISEKDKGIFDAMNKGLVLASGEWILFLNSGDILVYQDILDKIFSHIPKEICLIHGNTAYIDGIKLYTYKAVPFYLKNISKVSGMGICHQSIFVKTIVAKKMTFDLDFKVAADYNMVRKIYEAGGKFYYYQGVISAIDTNGYSVRNKHIQREEIFNICRSKINFNNKIWFFIIDIVYILRQIAKRSISKLSPSLLDKIRILKRGCYKL